MGDQLFFSTDGKRLRKGRRATKRTRVQRPAEFWPRDDEDGLFLGVIRNLSPYGLLLESDYALPVGTEICVELKRDALFANSLSRVSGRIARLIEARTGTWHMGVQLAVARPNSASKPIRITVKAPTLPERRARRMYSLIGGEEL